MVFQTLVPGLIKLLFFGNHCVLGGGVIVQRCFNSAAVQWLNTEVWQCYNTIKVQLYGSAVIVILTIMVVLVKRGQRVRRIHFY